jgi:mannose-6-phosphate isomerase-like protein (cupin superfamily)
MAQSLTKADELFYVIKSHFIIEWRDKTITLNKGELYIVPW